MAYKIYLSPSDQCHNAYACGLGTEQQHCTAIAQYTKVALERHGFEVRIGDNSRDETYPQRVTDSNAWGADLHIPIHTNASNGKTQGTLVMCHSNNDANMRPAKAVYDALVAVVPSHSGLGVKVRQDLYEINSTNAVCTYVECDFHDNPDVAAWIVGNHQTLGNAICKGVCDYYGVAYNGETAPQPTPEPTPQPEQPSDLPVNMMGQRGPTPDRKYSYLYDAAVEVLQRILCNAGAQIAVDGKAGEHTYTALQKYKVYHKDNGPLIKWVQDRLNDTGYNAGYADGVADQPTMDGIARFQEHYGLGVGFLGGTDWYYIIEM